MNFAATIANNPVVLTEGSVIERLRRNPAVELDPHVENTGLIYDAAGRATLTEIYQQYIDISRAFNLPMITLAPTWRANPERLRVAGLGKCAKVNADCVDLIRVICESYGSCAEGIIIGGLMGCKGDAYRPDEALSEREAASFHQVQVSALCDSGVDFVLAATLPGSSEAIGIARAISTCCVPYILSFVLNSDGTLLDGTPLSEIVSTIDSEVASTPLGYMVNCVHPSVFAHALDVATSRSAGLQQRIIGLQANTSTKSPHELGGLQSIDRAEEPEAFADAMVSVHRRFGTKILGGCCGTDDRHIRCIAERLVETW
ncbi:MAG: homocysteine S-methyltransferase family protein [Phycisphaerales bacterium]|nr:MAG: homocysteine S-methyltransferase family protein [Phycisphaerales bacterium]